VKIKKFRASTAAEAIDRVHRELGEDAVVLSTKLVRDTESLRRGERVEMTAAVDWESSAPDAGTSDRAAPPAAAAAAAAADDDAVPSSPSGDLNAIERRLEDLRRLLQQVAGNAPAPDELALEEIYRTVYASMIANDVAPVLALRVVRAARQALAATRERPAVAGTVQSMLRTLVPEPLTGRGRIQVLVGPTGVGKTTTAAKLAARAILEGKKPVVLVSCDTYRVAAVDQLRAYAGAMGARFELARDMVDLDGVLGRADRAGLVVVDTEGRGQRDLKPLEPLFRYLRSRDEVDRQLVLSATSKPKDLCETIERFRGVAPHGLIFTKLDETNSYGAILSESVRSGVPVSYLGTGQRVPEELLVATPQKIAELALSSLS
jgi:flagellar biosynthesis protein FlhF